MVGSALDVATLNRPKTDRHLLVFSSVCTILSGGSAGAMFASLYAALSDDNTPGSLILAFLVGSLLHFVVAIVSFFASRPNLLFMPVFIVAGAVSAPLGYHATKLGWEVSCRMGTEDACRIAQSL